MNGEASKSLAQSASSVGVDTPRNRYRNLWHEDLNLKKPAFYENTAKKVFSHRGVDVFKLFDRHFDYVFEGACITQRAGANAASVKEVVDGMLDGTEPVGDRVAAHLRACGLSPLTYEALWAKEAA